MAYAIESHEKELLEIISFDPNSGQQVGSAPISSAAEVEATVKRARASQPAWAALGLKGRTRVMRKLQEALVEQRDDLAELVSAESGKVLGEALIGDVLLTLTSLTGYLKIAPGVLKKRKVRQGLLHSTKRAYIVQEPLGVVAVISPYNYPVLLSMQSTFAALITGNTVVNKPSEHTPLTALRLKQIFDEAGLPEDVFQVVTGYGETGQALARAGVDRIQFVGSTVNGRKVAQAAAEQLIPVTLEMGGVNPMIVLDDAPMERTVDGLLTWSCVTVGQACGAVARAYVHEDIVDEFSKRVAIRARDWRYGPDRMPGNDMAALISESLHERVQGMLEDAVTRGAELVVDGSSAVSDAPVIGPTVLTNVSDDMTIMREESFGPVVAIVPFADDDEAINMANDSRYGLTASVWSRDNKRAWNIASQLEVGSVAINDHLWDFFAPQVPWGGVKDSGMGFVGGEWGLRSMVRPKVISFDKLRLKREFYWQPSPNWVYDFFNGAIPLLYSRKPGGKIKGLLKVVNSILNR